MKIYACQNQNFKARLIKTPALDILLDKISTDYSRQDAAKFCKKLRRLKPNDLTIKMPEMISNYNGRKIVLDLSTSNKKIGNFTMPVSESRTEIMYPNKIFKHIKEILQINEENNSQKKLFEYLFPKKSKSQMLGNNKAKVIDCTTDIVLK